METERETRSISRTITVFCSTSSTWYVLRKLTGQKTQLTQRWDGREGQMNNLSPPGIFCPLPLDRRGSKIFPQVGGVGYDFLLFRILLSFHIQG